MVARKPEHARSAERSPRKTAAPTARGSASPDELVDRVFGALLDGRLGCDEGQFESHRRLGLAVGGLLLAELSKETGKVVGW